MARYPPPGMTQDPPRSELPHPQQLLSRALALAQRLGGAQGVTPDALEAALEGEPVPALDEALLLALHPRLREAQALPRLVLSLLLRRWLVGSPLSVPWGERFAYEAVMALYFLGRLEFFPLRLTLLDALLASELPVDEQAELLLRRGNTRIALAPERPSLIDSALQDLEAAARLAFSQGLTRLEIEAECTRARAEFLELPGRRSLPPDELRSKLAQLEVLLPRAEPLGLAGDVHELLAELESRSIAHGPVGAAARAIQHARRSVEFTPTSAVKATRQALLAQLLLLHGTAEEAASSVQIAWEAVKSLPTEAGDLHAPQPHAALGHALWRHGLASESIPHLEYALQLMARQASNSNRNLIRLHLAQALLDVGRPDDARHHLERTFAEARALGDGPALSDAAQLLVRLDRQRGHEEAARQRLLEAEARLVGTPAQTLLSLLRLRPEPHTAPSQEFIELVRRYLSRQLPADEASHQILQASVANHTDSLPPDVRRQLLEERCLIIRDVTVRARLLVGEKRRDEALDLLRKVLVHSQQPEDRLRAATLLLALLPEEDREERLHACEEVEQRLEGSWDDPFIRTNLAFALWRCGREDKGLLERAWRHAERAMTGLGQDSTALTFNARARARIRLDQVSQHSVQASATTRQLAEWFTQKLPLPSEELSGYRCHAVWRLLAQGPLVPPEALALADRLLGLVPRAGQAPALSTRLQWIRARLASPDAPLPLPHTVPAEFHGSFDEAPGWAVALSQGQSPLLGRPLEPEEYSLALAVLQVRPDCAETVLEWLFSQSPDAQELDLLALQVTSSSPTASTRGLLDSVEKLAAEKPSYRLHRLRVAIHRRLVPERGFADYTQAVEALLASATNPEERVGAKLARGIERMEANRAEEARVILEEARVEARSTGLEAWKVFPVLVSAGNAFRRGRAPDLERALALYSEAEALGELSPDTSAQLWKVKAGALLARGHEGDAVQALALLEKTLAVRKTGHLRVETLLLAAEAEQKQPGREEPQRLRRALDRLDEAVMHAEGRYRLEVARQQIRLLARLVRLQPGDGALQRRLENLGQRHPELAEDIQRATRGMAGVFPEDVEDITSTVLAHPAGMVFVDATGPLLNLDLTMMDAQVRQRVEQQLQHQRAPQAIRARADRLAQVTDARARPGAMAARALLLAHVVEKGLAQREEVERLAHEAEQLVRRELEGELRLYVLLELSRVWAPENHRGHPVRDFQRAARLAREVRNESRPGGALARTALGYLARATRYRTDGHIPENLREAERLYEQCIQEHEAAGERGAAAHARMNLAELRAAQGRGNSLEDLRDGVAAAQVRIEQGGSPVQMTKAWLTLAIYLTRQASKEPPAQARATLLEAREAFDSVERSLLSTLELYTADNYRTICLANLAHQEGNREEALRLWRERLASLGPDAPPEVWAYTVHNLADMLLRPGAPPADVLEGLELSERILQVRTLESEPEHHWETCENIGRTIAHWLLSPGTGTLPPSQLRRLWERGRSALRRALLAARQMESHERLSRSASALLELARVAPSMATLLTTAEEGWSALDEARPYLLLDETAGSLEAHLAAAMAETLAFRLEERGLVGVAPGLAPVLSGQEAELVLRWMVRAAGAAQRRLAGRTARPEGVPHGLWVEWLTASGSGDTRLLGRSLDSLRQHAPLFLRGEPDLEGTWSWLRTRPGSVALAVVEGSRGSLAALLRHGPRREVLITRLAASKPPHDEASVTGGLSARGPGEEYRALLEWARRELLSPLSSLLPPTPSHLLWVPTGVLRLLAPADLWPSVPVTCAVRLDLETRPVLPRPRCTLLAVADPGPGSFQPLPGSVELVASLASSVQETGPVRVRMSRGARWGRALDIPCVELVEGPVSPDELLRELADVDVALLLCHGEVAGPQQARLLLVDGSGALVPLSMQRLADDPRRVAGATFVLLSCETGRVGHWLHRAAGLAGALLAGGAGSVIAPLWPVLLDPAWAVGRAVLGALARQEDPSKALQRLTAPESGPALGGPARVRREQETAWSLRAFVRWVG
ncbi:MAG TPA: hypothetical protein VF794_17050 [Archangium sp.]